MLVEADTGRERKVGAKAHKHSSPVAVVDVRVVPNDPALRELKVPSVRYLVADGRHDACGFSCLENDHDSIGLARSKYGSTNSSRRPFGASTIGMLCFAARCLTQH